MSLLRRTFVRTFTYIVFSIAILVMVFGLDGQQAFAQLAKPVGAGGGPALPVAITINLPQEVSNTYENVLTELTRAGLIAFFNALQLFFGQLAYDAATYIATGGKGQEAVFYKKGFGEYLKDVGSAAVGEFVGNLGDSQFFQHLGLNLCKPSNPALMLRLQLSLGDIGQQAFPQAPNLGLGGTFQRPRPRCDFQQVVDNYSSLYETMSNGDVLQNVQSSFDSSLSQLGSITGIYNRFLGEVDRQVSSAQQQRTEGQGFNPITNMISGNIRTPASVVGQATSNAVDRYPNERQSVVIGAMLSNAFQQGPIQLAEYTASIFLNTLASKFLKRIFETGISAGYTSTIFQNTGPDAIAVYGTTDARSANIDLKTPTLQKASTYDALSEMIACPPGQRGLWNCTIDQSFAQAIQSKGEQGGISIREALERKFLHSGWKLLPLSQTRENQDSLCYTYGYCAANLQKLRSLRIIPVGFEFAANSQANVDRCAGSLGCITLGEVVAQFNDCNAQGLSDGAHPWCHLIDPNWILTSFPQQCVLNGYSDTLISQKIGLRKEECSDVQTCLKRNDKGECVGGYGYCLAEKTVYRFQGDECPAYAASCRTYVNEVGQKVSYLRNTLDRAQCTADNAGCMWYATQRDFATTTPDVWLATSTTGEKIYFDSTLEGCDAANEGCSKLRVVTPGQSGLNLVINGSFERPEEGATTNLEGWKSVPTGLTPVSFIDKTTTTASFGGRALALRDPYFIRQKIDLVPGRSYAFSGTIRVLDRSSGPASARIALVPYDSAARPIDSALMDRAYHSCENLGGSYAVIFGDSGLTTSWQRFECTFVSVTGTAFAYLNIDGNSIAVDGVQLEEGEYATPFVDGISPSLPIVHMKLPPAGLTCDVREVTRQREAGLDTSRCNKFALSCSQADAGCQGYHDTEGGDQIPAIISQADLCPATCVGYAEYRKNPSAFDLVQDVDPRFNDPQEPTSTYMIARSAAQCTQEEVGCEEFTVSNPGGAGDGQIQNYSYLRACEKPDEQSETYFTWEGADTTGYQLRTWSLKRGTTSEAGPKILAKIQADQLTFKEPASCNEASWRTAADPDCRQFYNAAGAIFYRYFSQTVLSSNACISLRLNNSNRADCEKTGGAFNTRNECIYQGLPSESRVCRAQAAGCRMFLGNGASNVQNVLSENFRDPYADHFETASMSTSSEALLVGDYSLRVGPRAGTREAVATAHFPTDDLGFYRVSFWAKAPAASTSLTLKTSGQGSGEVVIGSVQLTSDWQRFTVGLFEGAPGASSTNLLWSAPLPVGGTYGFYLDEVLVSRVQDVVYLRKGTWTTPKECDTGLDGNPEPQAMLGCRRYQDEKNQPVNARRFTRLCRQESIGCTAFVDTRNSDAVGAQTFVQGDTPPVPGYGSATTVRQADRNVYLIDDPNKRCDAAEASCKAFGRPRFSPDRMTLDPARPFETLYFKDDITKYGAALCKPSELFCSEFLYGGNKDYFRDPDTHVCEYRAATPRAQATAGSPDAAIEGGWYISGTNTPCYPGIIESGSTFGIARSGDTTYKGWAGLCAEAQSECTEFRDVNDHTDPVHVAGRPYFFIHNDKIDSSSCSGNIDLGKGCVLFRDMSDSFLKYNVKASYDKYQAGDFSPVTPVNCAQTPDDLRCQQTGRCVGTRNAVRYSTIPSGSLNLLVSATTTSDWTNGATCHTSTECVPPATVRSGPTVRYNDPSGAPGSILQDEVSYVARCDAPAPEDSNNANVIVKVNVDRDCAQWLGCKSSETVRDPATNQYKSICTDLALCDQASGQDGDKFCANYVDRRSTSTEPILAQGAFFNIGLYTKRTVGLGEKDYSGYSLPGAFQVLDLTNTRVGSDGAKNVADAAFRFSQDYRLAAAIPMPPAAPNSTYTVYHHIRPAQQNEAEMMDGTPLASRYPTLSLCRQIATGRIGYYHKDERDGGHAFYCYVPVRGENDTYDFQNVAEKFTLADPGSDPLLTLAYPQAECRSYPEQDSPFPASYTTQWDLSKNPPQPKGRLAGFASVTTCEFGEDCACSYKRAEYGNSATRYFGVYSPAVPPGLCDGGPRNGQVCVPDTIFHPAGTKTVQDPASVLPAGAPPATPREQAIEGANVELTCGPPESGGRCLPFKNVSIVRGAFGNCLERDMTRIIGNNQNLHPCLTWNPNPVLFGDKDTYHFDPASGYFPPQNSGQYYCTADARAPRTLSLSQDLFDATGGGFADRMLLLYYDDSYVSDGAFLRPGNRHGATIDDVLPDGSEIGTTCEDTDDDQEGDKAHDSVDIRGLRLVTTGRGAGHSYTETFYKLDPSMISNRLNNTTNASVQNAQAAMVDNNFSYIRISPIRTPNGTARLGCGYNQGWVDGVTVDNYNDLDQVKPADTQWHDKFDAVYNAALTRGTEKVLTLQSSDLQDQGVLLRSCVPAPGIPAATNCFFKTWETDYRSQGKFAFAGVTTTDERSTVSFDDIRRHPVYATCGDDKSYFSIRAVFQTVATAATQGRPIEEFTRANSATVKQRISQIRGPWRLVGFWVSACGGRATDEQFIYMNVDLNFGDVCRELAEVVSRNSHQDAAFTDRVWKEGNFTVPGLGIQYNARYSPFSSALNTGPAGKEPLFQSGQEVTGYSPLHPPTFIASGLKTYYEKNSDPKDKYAYLSNIFARIYRVYRFYDQEISPTDSTCLAGPAIGTQCTPYGTESADPSGNGGAVFSAPGAAGARVSPQCSLNGVCDVNRFAIADASQANGSYCNSLSGINSGLNCPPLNDMCHFGPIQGSGSTASNRLLPCVTQPDWRPVDDDPTSWVHRVGGAWGGTTTQTGAADAGAFRCPAWGDSVRRDSYSVYGELNGSVRGQKCSTPTDQGGSVTGSRECPERIIDGATVGSPVVTPAGAPLDPAHHMIARCVRSDGSTRVSTLSGEQGRCRVSIPELRETLPNGSVFTLAAFDIATSNENYPSCYADYDCNFTQMNYYYNIPRSPEGISGSYFSSRSLLGTSYDGNHAVDCRSSGIDCMRRTVYRTLIGIPYPVSDARDPSVQRGGENRDQGYREYAVGALELQRHPGAELIPGGDDPDTEPIEEVYNIGACVRAAARTSASQGICTGGLYDGRICDFPDRGTGRTCIAVDYRTVDGQAQEARANICQPPVVSGRNATQCLVRPGSTDPLDLNYTAGTDLNSDNNICTHESGYVPKASLCPDPNDEFCGLIAYNIKAGEASFGRNATAPMPTDVTQGLYSPSYLSGAVGIPPRTTADETYAAYYKPHPPTIAAPNLRSCSSPGACDILGMNKMTFDGQTEGAINVAGNQNKSQLAFYAWAAHDQMPLRSLYIDWGDGAIQKIPDARLRNHKPFCGVLKQCVDPTGPGSSKADGLTCNTDSDCPTGTGVCKAVGTCRDKSYINCTDDSQCRASGGTDTCNFRTLFGNSPEACESNYFQFEHSYACQQASLPSCSAPVGRATIRPPVSVPAGRCYFGAWEDIVMGRLGSESARTTCNPASSLTEGRNACNAALAPLGLSTNDATGQANAQTAGVQCAAAPITGTTYTARCERDPARVCRTASDCAIGDRCLEGLAPPSDDRTGTGGCWDDQSHSCRFTPRILIQDNWGWCTGECRTLSDGAGGLRDDVSQSTAARPVALHPYGGCYAGSASDAGSTIRANNNDRRSFNNECSVLSPSSDDSVLRPWIVYPGSINLRGR